MFKRFHDNWRKFSHKLPENSNPLILAPANVKSFKAEQLTLAHPYADYFELLQLSAVAVGLQKQIRIRKPGAMHRARWLAKAIYSLNTELVFSAIKKK